MGTSDETMFVWPSDVSPDAVGLDPTTVGGVATEDGDCLPLSIHPKPIPITKHDSPTKSDRPGPREGALASDSVDAAELDAAEFGEDSVTMRSGICGGQEKTSLDPPGKRAGPERFESSVEFNHLASRRSKRKSLRSLGSSWLAELVERPHRWLAACHHR